MTKLTLLHHNSLLFLNCQMVSTLYACLKVNILYYYKHSFLRMSSAGGQFLRAYVERYNSPPVNNLITFGSQHMGISDIPGCSRYDFICQAARSAAKQAIYSEWAQNNIIQVSSAILSVGAVI